MRFATMLNSSVSGRLEPTVTPGEDYLAIYAENMLTEKVIKSIHVSYVEPGGTVTTAQLRIGRVKVIAGEVKPPEGSIQCDPFSPQITMQNEQRTIVDQLVYNTRSLEFPGGLIIKPGSVVTIICGASVGEADSPTSPSASYGYLTVIGEEYTPEQREGGKASSPRPRQW